MQFETISVHGGFICDPATKTVAPPIYQNVAYEFDSADHAAALFDLKEPGFRYSRIANPTVDILEQRVAALEGGIGALCVASGQAALHYALLRLSPTGADRLLRRRSFTAQAILSWRIRCADRASRRTSLRPTIQRISQAASTPRSGPYFARASAIQPAMFAPLGLARKSPTPAGFR